MEFDNGRTLLSLVLLVQIQAPFTTTRSRKNIKSRRPSEDSLEEVPVARLQDVAVTLTAREFEKRFVFQNTAKYFEKLSEGS
jgi:hypothetical protein